MIAFTDEHGVTIYRKPKISACMPGEDQPRAFCSVDHLFRTLQAHSDNERRLSKNQLYKLLSRSDAGDLNVHRLV